MVGLERGTVALERDHDEWRRLAVAEIDRVRDALSGIPSVDRVAVHHVGSTAIPDVPAKPVIDLLVVVEADDADPPAAAAPPPVAEPFVDALAPLGYELRENDGVADRRFLAKGPESNRTHYLSVTRRGAATAREQIAFRDALRADDRLAAEYARLKRDLAERYPDDRSAYTAAKSEFVERVVDERLDGA